MTFVVLDRQENYWKLEFSCNVVIVALLHATLSFILKSVVAFFIALNDEVYLEK